MFFDKTGPLFHVYIIVLKNHSTQQQVACKLQFKEKRASKSESYYGLISLSEHE